VTAELPRNRGLVKICGLREPEHASIAAAQGADLIGFIFAPSRRQITPEHARRCIEMARSSAIAPLLAVGVFVNATAEEIADTVARSGIDVVQLHGKELPSFSEQVAAPTLRAYSPPPDSGLAETEAHLRAFCAGSKPPLALLLDGYHPGGSGGAGVRADWAMAAELATRLPIILAGGPDPMNVAEAIRTVHPLGVDVSSGVETDGIKDPAKIETFIANARAGFAD